MTSDEKNLDPVEAAFYYGADGVPSYIAGYTQGRADAWMWIPVSERLPENEGRYAIVYGQRLWVADWLGDRWATMLPDVNITHWLPIQLPTEAK